MEVEVILSVIFGLAKAINKHAGAVRANKSQCARLAKRVDMVTESLKKLWRVSDLSQYEQTLTTLQTSMEHSLKLVNKFSDQMWFKKVLKAGTYKNNFIDLTKELQEIANLLNLDVVAQLATDRENDREDQKNDSQDIIAQTDTIVRLQYSNQTQLEDLTLNQQQQATLFQEQMRSIQEQLKALSVEVDQPEAVVPAKKDPIDSKYIIPHYDLLFNGVVDEGSFGVVYRGTWRDGSVAIKTLKSSNDETHQEFLREADILSRLRSPNIVQFIGACLERGRESLVMEFMSKGSLFNILKIQSNPFTAAEKKSLALDIANGLRHLHSSKVLHKDLKSSNVLLDRSGRAKLCDFRIADIRAKSVLSIHKESVDHAWMPPEVLKKKGSYTEAADIYSFGVVLWEILTGKNPGSNHEAMSRLSTEQHLTIPSTVPKEYADILNGCWAAEPLMRFSLQEIIRRLEQIKVVEKVEYSAGVSPQPDSTHPTPPVRHNAPSTIQLDGRTLLCTGDRKRTRW